MAAAPFPKIHKLMNAFINANYECTKAALKIEVFAAAESALLLHLRLQPTKTKIKANIYNIQIMVEFP
mgnify:CR=1 FL=1